MARPKKTAKAPQPHKAPLAQYVRAALGDNDATIFQDSDGPDLVSNQVCRILTFRGSFNPPHQGHKDVLCHGFYRGGRDLHIVAAFVYFLNEIDVDRKYNHSAVDIVHMRYQRIQLFNGGGITGGWHYCYPRGMETQIEFQNRLIAEAAKDGFEIEFLVLCGPDLIFEGPQANIQGNRLVVGTGDPERTFFRGQTETGLRQLQGYGEWEMKAWTESFEQQFAHEGPNKVDLEPTLTMLFPHLVSKLPDTYPERTKEANRHLRTALSRVGGNRHCEDATGRYERWIRYVPLQYFGMTGGAWFVGALEQKLSSTRIRRILAEEEDEKVMLDALTGVALSPALLVEFIMVIRRILRGTKGPEFGYELKSWTPSDGDDGNGPDESGEDDL